MRRNLLKKANYLLPKVKIISETDYSIRCEVTSTSPHEVVFKYENYKLILLCNCTMCSQKPDAFCSHKFAAITYLTLNPETIFSIETIEPDVPIKPIENIYDDKE